MPRKIKLLKSTVTPEQWEAHLAANRLRRANWTPERQNAKRESNRAWLLANFLEVVY
jgi:hypothetical protein